MEKNQISVKTVVITAFFAAITFLGIQSFRIPLPAAVGTPFVHFGHIFVVMGVLLQGGKRGAVSGTLGFILFDLLNGYMQAMPQVFVETIVKCLILGAVFQALQKVFQAKENGEYLAAVLGSCVYGAVSVLIEFVMGTIMLMVAGSGFMPAAIGSATSVPASAINAVFMIIVIAIIYNPVKRIYKRMA